MYPIGQFSVMTKIPAKTLRYYDEIDLLKAARVDNDNNYRYYDNNSVLRAQQILVYRNCGLPLKEIKHIIDNSTENKTLKAILQSQLKVLDQKASEIKNSCSMILNIIQSLEEEKMSKVVLEPHGLEHVLSIRERGGHDAIGRILSRLFETAMELNLKVAGPHSIVWYEDKDFNKESIDMEIYIPIDRNGEINSSLYKKREKELYCQTVHKGSLATLSSAYTEIHSFIKEKGLKMCGPFQETYLSNMRFVNPSEMEVRVAVPVREEVRR
jgi:DNA-binding transcriptional MerR regulator